MQEALVVTLLCPVCHRMFEVPGRVVFQGNLCRCQRCWKVLEIISVQPTGLREKPSHRLIGSGTRQHANPVGDRGGYEC